MGKTAGIVAVTGASGLVGSHLVRELLKGEDRVRLILRENSSLERLEQLGILPSSSGSSSQSSLPGSPIPRSFPCVPSSSCMSSPPSPHSRSESDRVEVIRVEFANPYDLCKAFQDVDVVYHCAAVVSFDSACGDEIIRINREITANVVDACMECGVRRLVHVSSIATLGECLPERCSSDVPLIDEECYLTTLTGRSAYSVSKFYAENQVNRGIYQGLDAVIVNPAIILGEGDFDHGSGQIIKLIAGGGGFSRIASLFATSGVKGYVDVRDVVRAMCLLADCDAAAGQRFILSSENLSFRELFTLIARSASRRAPIFTIGGKTMRMFAKAEAAISRVLGRTPMLSPEIVSNAIDKSYYSGEKIKKYIDFEYTPISDSVRRVTESYLKQEKR